MPNRVNITLDIYLAHSELEKVSKPRRIIGALFLDIARWLLKSELRIEEVKAQTPPPLRYWQHDETGRVCATVLQPSERWYEITKGQYVVHAYKLP